MIRAMWSAATGMNAQQMMIDVMANNLANVNTTGFKKSRANFEDLFYATYQEAGAPTARAGPCPWASRWVWARASVSAEVVLPETTWRPRRARCGHRGDRFFRLLSGDQEVYSRDGSFKRTMRIHSELPGQPLQPDFAIPGDTASITIAKDGEITCLSSEGESSQPGRYLSMSSPTRRV